MKLSYLLSAIAILSLTACKKDRVSADKVNTVKEDDYTICTSDHWNEVNYEGVQGDIGFVYDNKYYEPENDASQAGNNRMHVFDGSVWTVKNSIVPVKTNLPAIVFTISNRGYAADLSGPEDAPIKFYEYNITTNTWTRKADFPGRGKYGIASFTASGKGYAVGGYRTNGEPYPYTAENWQYDPLLNVWTEKKGLVIKRALSVGFSINNKGYITNGTFPNNLGFYASTMQYDPVTDEWTRKADFPGEGRVRSKSFVIGDNAYVGGGYGTTKYNDFYKYSAANDTWTRVDDFPVPAPDVSLSSAFSMNSKGYVVGNGGLFKYTPRTCGYVFEPTTNTGN